MFSNLSNWLGLNIPKQGEMASHLETCLHGYCIVKFFITGNPFASRLNRVKKHMPAAVRAWMAMDRKVRIITSLRETLAALLLSLKPTAPSAFELFLRCVVFVLVPLGACRARQNISQSFGNAIAQPLPLPRPLAIWSARGPALGAGGLVVSAQLS